MGAVLLIMTNVRDEKMVHRIKYGLLFPLSLMLVLVMLSLIVSACWADPMAPLCIHNQTNQTLSIFIHEILEGEVAPGAKLKVEGMPDIYWDYPIEAKNPQGEVVFSRVFKWEELHDMKWKVVIPPLEKGMESSDNVTGR
ncbi:hypothetical protein ACFLTR_01145 [Chloroflexota bacterium]